MANNLWTREELILALNLYLTMDFGKMHSRNPDIIHLAVLIGRTPGSVAMRLTNFASVDPQLQQRGIVGLRGGLKQVEPIWNEFINNREDLLFESEKILADMEHNPIETKYADILTGTEYLKGETKLREVKTRVNQDVFRRIVLTNYSGKCAICGLDIPALLNASHIVPWALNEKERLNPENGICLSALYDRAFDIGHLGFTESYEILISNELKGKQAQDYFKKFFAPLSGRKLNLPAKYLPRKEFMEFHYEMVFRK